MKRSIWIIGGIVLAVVLLAGAAFVGARLLQIQAQPSTASGGPTIMLSGPGGTQSIELVPAAELPASEPGANGILLRREDNSLIVGTGEISIRVGEDGEVGASHSGPEVEITVTHDTVIYNDETDLEAVEDGKVQQVLEPGSLDDVDKNAIITVWGEKRGDRLFAEVLVYEIPGR